VETDGFEGKAERAVIGLGDEVERIADYVVDFGVFCGMLKENMEGCG
jgi:hypothetical protein